MGKLPISLYSHRVTALFPRDRANTWNHLLSMTGQAAPYPRDCVIDEFDVEMAPGKSVNIKLCNGDKDAGPWLDVTCWDDPKDGKASVELGLLDPCFSKIEGEYRFDCGFGRDITLIVEIENA